MKFTYNWLKDYVDIKISPNALAGKLTMAGLEVSSIEERDGDFVFEIEITSNRPDWLSVIGIAREIAAITKNKIKLPKMVYGSRSTVHNQMKNKKLCGLSTMDYGHLQIYIENKQDCPLYTAKIIKDVKIGPSPDWMRKRLELIGCRSINNVVDITNYVLFTWGEPLHAFDLDKFNSACICVRRARQGEKVITIDGQDRLLNEETLVIAGNEKVVAIAGVMGGKDTEVTAATKNILLEAAVFDPIIVRRARQALGISTDSSYRFERGVPFETAELASERAVELINKVAGGDVILAKKSGAVKLEHKTISLNADNVANLLGVEINAAQIKTILTKLGFSIKPEITKKLVAGKRKQFKSPSNFKKCFLVKTTGLRPDVKQEIDLIEEIARVFSFEKIPTSLPKLTPNLGGAGEKGLIAIIKNIMTGLGLNEVITYSLIDKGMLKGFETACPDPIEILNPLSKEQEILRPTLIPSLLKCVAHNLNQKQEKITIFEVASSFSQPSEGFSGEELVLGITLCGIKSLLLEQGAVKERLGVLHLKGIIETLFERFSVKGYNFQATGEQNEIFICVGDKRLGRIIILQENILGEFGIKNKAVAAAEIYLEKVFTSRDLKKKFVPLPVYPGITRDISLVVHEKYKAEEILSVIKENAGNLLREVNVVDYYKGKQIAADSKGLTITCVYRSDERTLNDSEITPLHSSICEKLINKFTAKLR